MTTDQTTERREDYYCANPRHLARAGLNAPALAAWPTYELCQFRGASRDCIPAVLVPVTQREAEQRVLDAANEVKAVGIAGMRMVHAVNALSDRLAELAAVAAIPVDTEAGNVE